MIEVARTPLGGIAIDPRALSGLVRGVAEGAGGVRVRSLDISLDDGGAATATVWITAPRRAVLPELGALVLQRTADALQTALDAQPARVDITIAGIHVEEA